MTNTDDLNLLTPRLLELENAENLQAFFAELGYEVDEAIDIDASNFNVTGDLQTQITRIRKLAVDPADQEIEIYLFELRRVNMRFIQDVVKLFQKRPGRFIIVFARTKNWDELEFILLDRIQSDTSKTQLGRSTLTYGLRPRFLSLNRKAEPKTNELRLATRVLKRFTFTEVDALAQWDKLRSAYTIAEWSEPEFNNRALFSDYYLSQRLPDNPMWSNVEVRDLTQIIGRDVQERLSLARKQTTPQARGRDHLVMALLKQLGFRVETAPEGEGQPHFLLYGADAAPLTQVLAYDWNRNLDDRDPQRDSLTPDDIPGAKVVSLLERAATAWIVVTNGKLWRLYSTTTSNRATNYYEVDLEEALAAPDRIAALKYWWLMFRPDAFTGVLDSILAGSADYAKGVRESLKDRVFTEIFPKFAHGFILDMRSKGMSEADIQARLGDVFNGTMTFLYRLMFILYAESLELLPLTESVGYGEFSLRKMKTAIAEQAGPVREKAAERLRAKYTATSITMYERLKELFAAIDSGNENLNLPAYNGGLFNPETENGQFLNTYAVPDQDLALGIDLLARDLDPKRSELVPIDFKSLGVRHLGSIYEGLLEFKLSIANEDLTVVKDGNREVYTPVASAPKNQKTAAPKVAVKSGEVYLQNDKRERKATGSYYTPGYIVKYIVEHTVGPVLTRKIEALTPRLREAQAKYRARKASLEHQNAKPGATYEDPEKFWNDKDMRDLADECLNIKVLDPAMGSGHFLVQVVDFISERLLSELERWSENPVWALLERTRRDIRDDLVRQGVTLDTDRLTRVNLLKRAVLKRCVYGVDLNPMAVELAKVSLWLDAFTVGAPLSFLDHHLKNGNSLIGATDLTEVVAVGSKRWEFILEAATEMVEVSKSTDSTVGQVHQSKQDYEQAQAKLEDVKKYANVPVASYFVDKLNEYRKSNTKYGIVGQVAMIAYGKHQGVELQELFERAQITAEERKFFHWRLEFPEVFIDLKTRDWAVGGGFEVVVGNPPYDILKRSEANQNKSKEIDFYRDNPTYITAQGTMLNIFRLFLALGKQLVQSRGWIGEIIPLSFMSDASTSKLRKSLISTSELKHIECFPQKDNPNDRVFEDAKLSTMIVCLQNGKSTENIISRVHPGKDIVQNSPTIVFPVKTIEKYDSENFTVPIGLPEDVAILEKIYLSSKFSPMSQGFNISVGEIDMTLDKDCRINPPNDRSAALLKGAQIQRYETRTTPKQGEIEWVDLSNYQTKYKGSPKLTVANRDRVAFQGITGTDDSRRLTVTLVPLGTYLANSVNYISAKDVSISSYFILALMNSQFLEWRFRLTSGNNNVNNYEVKALPYVPFAFTTTAPQREAHVTQFRALYTQADYASALAFAALRLSQSESDVVHDALAFLAEQMIDLNKQKQAETKRFLSWLESTLKIKPQKDAAGLDALTGKTKLQNYLGDYQKGQRETVFGDFWHVLRENRRRFHITLDDVEAEIETAYAASLRVLLPIKQQLARTDLLIDQIVYKLYGLTDEEIALIERPQKEQALKDALAAIPEEVRDDPEKQDEVRVQVAEAYEQASVRFTILSPSQQAQASLDQDYPTWRSLPIDLQLLLEDAERDTLDGTRRSYNGAIINYASVTERMINETLLVPFRAQGYTSADVINDRAFKPFMDTGKPIMLGSMIHVLTRDEKTFAAFVRTLYADADTRIFDSQTGLRAYMKSMYVAPRNDAGHGNRVCSQTDAQDARQWALSVLKLL